MKRLTLLVVLLAGGLAMSSSCNSKKQTTAAETAAKVEESKTEEMKDEKDEKVKNIVIQQGYKANEKSAPYQVAKAEIVDDILHLTVTYSGGCEEHSFTAYSNKMYAKSLPPQLTIFVEHENNGDMCRAMLTEDIYFRLNDVRYPGSDKVLIRINDLNIEPVMYAYKN